MTITFCVNTALPLCPIVRKGIHAAVIISSKKVQPLLTTETPAPSQSIDTDISALQPPALLVTVVRHIVPVIPDVAVRVSTVPGRRPGGGVDQEDEYQSPPGHFQPGQIFRFCKHRWYEYEEFVDMTFNRIWL